MPCWPRRFHAPCRAVLLPLPDLDDTLLVLWLSSLEVEVLVLLLAASAGAARSSAQTIAITVWLSLGLRTTAPRDSGLTCLFPRLGWRRLNRSFRVSRAAESFHI